MVDSKPPVPGRPAGSRGRRERMASGPAFSSQATETTRIGRRLRKARLNQELSLEQVARRAGLTKGFLSQLERDMASPSVASLVRLCEVVQISIGSLFEPASTSLTRAAEAPLINFGGTGLRETLLTPRSSELQLIRSEVAPGGGSGDESYTLDAKAEFVHVVHGQIVIVVDGENFELGVGDTLSFLPQQAHAWYNPSKRSRAVVLWALAPSPW